MGRRGPVNRPHTDYTANSGLNRLKQLFPEDAEKLQQNPFAIIQVCQHPRQLTTS